MTMKNRLLLFLCACVPGCGQMYQGYMRRGVSLLSMGCGIIAVASFLRISELAILLPVLWAYAFFDSFNLRTLLENGTAPTDEYLFGLSELDSRRLGALLRKKHSILGWLLVAVGLYLLYDTVIRRVIGVISEYYPYFDWLYSLFVYDLPRLVVTILIIALGIWFIRGPKGQRNEADFDAFVPPEEVWEADQNDGDRLTQETSFAAAERETEPEEAESGREEEAENHDA